MIPDSWISAETAGRWLAEAGYHVDPRRDCIAYRKTGISGKIAIHPQGVDERALLRLMDRGS